MSQEGTSSGTVTPTITAFTCPMCRWVGEFDNRFTAWCESCGYNAEPPPEKPQKARVARREARKRARAEKFCDELIAVPDLRPTSGAGVAVVAAAVLVHLTTLALLVTSIVVITTLTQFWFEPVLGVLGVLTAVAVRPRLWKRLRMPRDMDGAVTRSSAPNLFALLDRCAAQVGASSPDYVFVDGRFNAATGKIGFKRQTVIRLGVPMWELFSGQERIALLGHELAHQVNGDVSRGLLVSTARQSIAEWMRLFNPKASVRTVRFRRRRSGGLMSTVVDFAQPVFILALFGPAFLVVFGCRVTLDRLDPRTRNRAEYLADELGTRLGSSAAGIGVTEWFAMKDSVRYYIQRERSARFTGDLWPALREYIASVPGHEWRRRVRLDMLHGASVDSTHPADYLRRRLIAGRPQHAAALSADEVDWASIDAELKPYRTAVGNRLLGVKSYGTSNRDAEDSPESEDV